ncbi:Stk1 family PASTA domain-containing Ser/Thr kinase [Eubacterium xylanophilum]|uniref:Stk1 family PASTA domain-containing Ser/Thr kinase n=1 Tax=Eubacterium xylanophilum TaxID=39497 RepID=UPI0004B5A842|nr:Stk1 family PASTA domain-containing Ser/Thr kinase [Eubacterium xylanophilum]
MLIEAGTIIADRYEILEKVGSGGMADVYKAKCHRLNRYVAIKILKNDYSEDTKFVTKFKGEAQAVAVLSHPNVVSIFDVGEERGMYYFVMELIDGITLKKYIEEKGKLTIKEAVGIALQIANGLDAAHRNNIIHRDIKPQNILIARDGTAKVTDFGIAKSASSNTITANAMGSVHYISPEQARGGYSDEKSDIYSLGVTMYEMLSGTLPFNGETAVAIALAHVQEDVAPLAAIDATIPRGLSNIVAKCMQKKPELRYLSAADLIADLKMFMQDPSGEYGIIGGLYDDEATKYMSREEVKTIREASRNNIGSPVKVAENEPEDVDDNQKMLNRAVVGGSIAAALVIGGIVIYILGLFIGLWGGSSPATPQDPATSATPTQAAQQQGEALPDFSNELKDKVVVELGNMELKYTLVEEASDTVEKDNVIRTNPAAGSIVKPGDSVELVISTGVEQISVPDVSRSTVGDAMNDLQQKGFTVKQGDDVYSSVPVGRVAYTKPAAGKKVNKGATITLFASKGEEVKVTTVPNIVGMRRSKAKAALKAAGLVYGSESQNYSSTTPKNRVCVQSVASGKQVEEGTQVDVTISLGEETTYSYVGSVTIDNPFEYETDPSAKFEFVLTQSGASDKVVRKATLSYNSFPYTISDVEGANANTGKIVVYKDGENVASYSISFKKVAN